MDAALLTSLVVPGIGLVLAALMLVHAWEHRRYHSRRWASPLKPISGLSVALIVPCKGLDRDLKANLTALCRQWYPRYELCFVVESEFDPAIGMIRELAQEYPQISQRIVIAGLAQDCGQKVHNLITASQTILNNSSPPDVLAFVDSDACPHAEWLARLVERLAHGRHAVATGYRWYVPATRGWANRLLSAINNTVLGVMGPHGFNLVWGGAWAIRTDEFRKLGLPDAWQGSLSDDLVISRLIHRKRLGVAYEPNCLVQSTADFDWPKFGEFLRRQFVVVRVYAPLWWQFGFWAGLITNLCFWGALALAGNLAANQGPWAIPLAGGLLWYLAGAVRARLAAQAIRPFVVVSNSKYRRVARVNVWGWPLVSLATWLGIVSAAFGRTIVWRGIRYRLDSAQKTTIIANSADRNSADCRNSTTETDERDSHARTTRAA
jgi:hypothetical protein